MQIDFFEVTSSDNFDKSVNRLVKKKRFLNLPRQIKELTLAF